MSQIYIEHDFTLRSDNGVLKATNGLVAPITGTTNQIIDGTGGLQTLNTSIVAEGSNLYFTTSRAQASISGSAPINVTGGVVSISQASSTTNGYLSSTDWNTFNSKQQGLSGIGFVKVNGSTISYDNSSYYLSSNPNNYIPLTSLSASSPLGYNNTTGVFSISQSSASANGYLSSTDWNTFNSKQSSLTFGNVTGSDFSITGGTGSVIGSGLALSLAIVNSNTYATNTFLKFSVNSKGLVTAASIVGGADIISALGYTPEDVANKSTSTSLGTSNTLYPTQNAVKTYIDSAVAGVIILQGDWNASTNSPNISGTTTIGWAWRVSVDGATNLGGITDWKVGDLAVKSASGWLKIDNTDGVTSVFGRYGAIVATSGDYTTAQVTESGNLYYTDTRARASLSFVAGSGAYNSSTGIITIPTNTSQLTNGANFITLGSLSATSPISYNSGTGAISISQATASTNGYLSSTDWNTFNNKLSTATAASTYVPYTGATSDVDLGTHKLSLNSEQFASISAPSYSEGALWYDSTQKALAYYNDISGNVLHIGQEVQLKVHNNTGSTIAKGAPVYVTSTSSGYSYPNIALAKADNLTTANVIGLANQAIPNGTDGYITLSGLLTGANTGSFTVGDILYLSPYSAGQLMNTLPPTGYAVRVGVVSYSNTPNGTIYINQSNAYSAAGSIVGTIAIAQGGTGATTSAGALTNLGGIGLTSLSASAPLSYNNTTGAFSISQATTSTNGYLSSTDWNTFNNKQNALGFVPIGGSGVSYQVAWFNATNSIGGSSNLYFDPTNNRLGINQSSPLYSLDVTGASRITGQLILGSTITNGTYTYTLPSATGTLALTSQIPSLSGYVTGTAASGQVSYFNGTSSIAGSNNHYWDSTNNRLGIGLTNPQRSLEIYSATADSHLRLSGAAPSVSMGEAITGSVYQAKFGLATASGQYVSGAVAGDFVIISQTGATIWANSGGERMRLNTNGTFSIGNTNSTYNLDVTGTGRFTGNVGIGYAPNTWFSGYVVLEMGSGALVYPANAINTQLWNNLYVNTAGNSIYKSTGIGGLFSLGGGGNAATIYSAPSGTAGATATLTALLTIANGGAATFSSSVTASNVITNGIANGLNIIGPTGNPAYVTTDQSVNNGGKRWRFGHTGGASGFSSWDVYNQTDNITALSIAATGVATFSRNDAANINLILANAYLNQGNLLNFQQNNGGTTLNAFIGHGGDNTGNFIIINNGIAALSFAKATGAATFSSSVTATKAILGASSATSSVANLEVFGSTQVSTNNGQIRINDYVTTSKTMSLGVDGTNNVGFIQSFQDGVAYRSLILNGLGGNVGIGTSSPDRVLTVNGQFGINNDIVSTKGGTNFRIGYEAYTSTGGVNMFTESAIPLVLGTSSTERMRITSGGNVLIGTSGTSWPNTVGTYIFYQSALNVTRDGAEAMNLNRLNSDGTVLHFHKNGSQVGSVSVTGSSTSYNTSSDYRLKQDLKYFSGLDLVSSIKTYDYEWKIDKTRAYGVIAHELAEIIPYAVSGEKDGEQMQGVDYSKIVPVLVKAIQELSQEVNELKSKLA